MAKARRHNKTKERPSLNVAMADKLAARRWTKGAEKYTLKDEEGNIIEDGTFNWKKGFPTTKIIDSLERHLLAIKMGEDIDWDWDAELDKKFGLSTHYDGLIINAQMLIDQYYRNLPDDRPYKNVYRRIGLDIDGVVINTLGIEHENYDHYGDHIFLEKYAEWLESDYDIVTTPLTSEARTMNFEPVVYVTSRPERIRDATLDSIAYHGLPAAPVVFTEDKVAACKEHRVELFVDDYYNNFCKLNQAGIKCLLMDRSYNRKYDVGHLRINHLKLI